MEPASFRNKLFFPESRQRAASLAAFLLLILPLTASAQSFEWKANAYGFFDNGEYTAIDPYYSRTYFGMRFSPEIGISYKAFSLFAGTHLQTYFGSPKYLDKAFFTGYFQYKSPHHHFLFGAFPRQGLLDNFTNFYIRDTFQYFRPNMTGIFYQATGKNNFLNLYLDWVGLQSEKTREMFFAGLSGEQRYKWFFAALNAYYFHYAQTSPASGDGCVHDNGQGQIGIGVDFSGYARLLEVFRLQVAYMLGYECKRDHSTPVKMPMGMVVDLHARYWRIGTRTLYYYGQERYTVPTDVWADTYWGNPFLRAKSYLQSQWYVSIFRNNFVEAKAAFVFHLQGNRFGTQQMVQLSVNLDGSIRSKKDAAREGGRYRFNFIENKEKQPQLPEKAGKKPGKKTTEKPAAAR